MDGHRTNIRMVAVSGAAALFLAAGVPAAAVGAASEEVVPGDTPAHFWPHETGVQVGTGETFANVQDDGSYDDPSTGRHVLAP
jgi:hypothetical protein